MHERTRAPERSRQALPTSEAWHELSRFVTATKAGSVRRPGAPGDADNGDRSG